MQQSSSYKCPLQFITVGNITYFSLSRTNTAWGKAQKQFDTSGSIYSRRQLSYIIFKDMQSHDTGLRFRLHVGSNKANSAQRYMNSPQVELRIPSELSSCRLWSLKLHKIVIKKEIQESIDRDRSLWLSAAWHKETPKVFREWAEFLWQLHKSQFPVESRLRPSQLSHIYLFC